MKQAKIFYFSLQDEQTRVEKLAWFAQTKLDRIPFEQITPDQKGNWINQTDNDFDRFLPLIDKQVKAGKSQQAVFKLFSSGVQTKRDEWMYAFSKKELSEKVNYLIHVYQARLEDNTEVEFDIKWDADLDKYTLRKISKKFDLESVRLSISRPFSKLYLYLDRHFNSRTFQIYNIFPEAKAENILIAITNHTQIPFLVQAVNCVPSMDVGGRPTQCLPLYRYENGKRHDNITDWGLTQFQTHYSDTAITKLNIFHYTYAVLHHPVYRSKYELNLKREFPRLPFYENFHQWAVWGKQLMELHINYETIEPFGLVRRDVMRKDDRVPKAKLKADKAKGSIALDEDTTLEGVPAVAWEYKLGNRSALEWILDQYKEKKPKDPTIREKFNTYRFADYKEQVIDLLDRVCRVSVETMQIIEQMPEA